MNRPSRSFTWDEFNVSKDHPELAAKIALTELDRQKIFYLCQMVLQPIRDTLGKPVVILSGKRSPELNAAVGGAKTSDHLYLGEACAVDFTVPGIEMKIIYHGLCLKQNTLGQLIFYPKQNFIHVSLPSQKHINEAFEK